MERCEFGAREKETGQWRCRRLGFRDLLAAMPRPLLSRRQREEREREERKKNPSKISVAKGGHFWGAFLCFCLLARENMSYRDVEDKEGWRIGAGERKQQASGRRRRRARALKRPLRRRPTSEIELGSSNDLALARLEFSRGLIRSVSRSITMSRHRRKEQGSLG